MTSFLAYHLHCFSDLGLQGWVARAETARKGFCHPPTHRLIVKICDGRMFDPPRLVYTSRFVHSNCRLK